MQSNQPDPYDLPPELCVKPLALIGATGLDTLNNAVHKTIWDAFSSNRRPDRAPIQFKLLNNAHEFPVLKPKRNSYEWYIPKGILKRNWINKHLNEIPAVIVIFYDLDWNDLHWNEKLIECSSRVHSMRAAIDGRNTRIVVVLVQQTAPLPTGEDMLAAERATALCASCELNAKHLFVLPHGDHLHGYTARLENAFYDLAQGYYQHEARNIKAHRDHLNKITHQYLLVRHQFKMGFLNELKQDNHTAHKHYTYAYTNLQELRMVDTNAMEIRTIAGYINYKLCRVMFALTLPRDAISQFRAHVDRYKARVGFKELAFEHYAWLSKQFSVFGDLFDEAIRLGLPAVQTQHPGFYYQQAAQHAVVRKHWCHELCALNTSYPVPDPLEGGNRLEHYGQRPWRPGRLSAEPPDPALEQAAIEALQWKERNTINHSNIIIALYGNAISQFKTYRCPRMRRALVVQMADEYYCSNDYGKALTLLTHMLWDYRSEKWFSVLAVLLKRAICCAQLSANIQDYVVFALEILSDSIPLPEEYKVRIHENLLKVLKKLAPDAEPGIPEMAMKTAQHLWVLANAKNDPTIINVEMNNISLSMQAKARFKMSDFPVHDIVTIEITIRSCSMQTLHFSGASVIINSPNYSTEVKIIEGNTIVGINNPTLWFQNYETKKYEVQFKPNMQDAGKEIQISSILLYMGNPNERQAVLKFTGQGNEIYSSQHTHPEFQSLQPVPKKMPPFFELNAKTTAQIISRPSNLECFLIHEAPSLVGEWYPITLHLKNEEDRDITDVVVEINVTTDNSDHKALMELCTVINTKPEKLPLKQHYPKLEIQSSQTTQYYMRSNMAGDLRFSIKITYYMALPTSQMCPCLKEHVVIIRAVKPLEFECQYFTPMFEEITSCFLNEQFAICPLTTNVSPWPILIEKAVLDVGPTVKIVESVAKHITQLDIEPDGVCSDLSLAVVTKLTGSQTNMGQYIVNWKRVGSTTPTNVTTFSMPVLPSEYAALKIELSIDSHAVVLRPMAVVYRLHNNTDELLQIDLCMDASDAFMFAGHKQKQISILPDSDYVLRYTLYPLVLGKVSLPKLRLGVPEHIRELQCSNVSQDHLAELLDRSLIPKIFVLPQVRGNPQPVTADLHLNQRSAVSFERPVNTNAPPIIPLS